MQSERISHLYFPSSDLKWKVTLANNTSLISKNHLLPLHPFVQKLPLGNNKIYS